MVGIASLKVALGLEEPNIEQIKAEDEAKAKAEEAANAQTAEENENDGQ